MNHFRRTMRNLGELKATSCWTNTSTTMLWWTTSTTATVTEKQGFWQPFESAAQVCWMNHYELEWVLELQVLCLPIHQNQGTCGRIFSFLHTRKWLQRVTEREASFFLFFQCSIVCFFVFFNFILSVGADSLLLWHLMFYHCSAL